MIVVVLIPIAFGVPFLGVFVPPAAAVFPAPLPGGGQLSAAIGCLRTIPAMVLSGFVQIVVGFGDALLAVFVRAQLWCARQHKSAGENGSWKQHLAEE
jgi:hypothetical protein